jgi:hypothetical protein
VASTPDIPPSDPWSAPPAYPPPAYPPPAYPPPAYAPPGMPVSPGPDPTGQMAMAPGPVILQVGDISVTSTVVRTPAGDIPLAGSNWQVSDYWYNEQKIPTWAIFCAVAGFCVLTVFSLLFLLVKVTVPRGTVQVTVTNGSRQYVARIPVTDQSQVTHINQQVNYVRSLAAL